MKTQEELNVIKNEMKALNEKLAELSEDELKEVTAGIGPHLPPNIFDHHEIPSI